jgi:hypothetical protein
MRIRQPRYVRALLDNVTKPLSSIIFLSLPLAARRPLWARRRPPWLLLLFERVTTIAPLLAAPALTAPYYFTFHVAAIFRKQKNPPNVAKLYRNAIAVRWY